MEWGRSSHEPNSLELRPEMPENKETGAVSRKPSTWLGSGFGCDSDMVVANGGPFLSLVVALGLSKSLWVSLSQFLTELPFSFSLCFVFLTLNQPLLLSLHRHL